MHISLDRNKFLSVEKKVADLLSIEVTIVS